MRPRSTISIGAPYGDRTFLPRRLRSHDPGGRRSPRISGLLERVTKVVSDLGRDDVRVGEVLRVIEALVLEPEEVELCDLPWDTRFLEPSTSAISEPRSWQSLETKGRRAN